MSWIKICGLGVLVLVTAAASWWFYPTLFSFYDSVVSGSLRQPTSVVSSSQMAESLSEFDKLSLILEKYRHKDVKIIVDGREYQPELVWRKAREILFRHRQKIENAAAWIKVYCYRSNQGNPFYVRYPDGRTVLLRDLFLSELTRINSRTL